MSDKYWRQDSRPRANGASPSHLSAGALDGAEISGSRTAPMRSDSRPARLESIGLSPSSIRLCRPPVVSVQCYAPAVTQVTCREKQAACHGFACNKSGFAPPDLPCEVRHVCLVRTDGFKSEWTRGSRHSMHRTRLIRLSGLAVLPRAGARDRAP